MKPRPDDNDLVVLLFDTKLRQPGCVLLQAMAGCADSNGFLQMTFDNWLTHPTPDMKRIRGTKKQWRDLAQAIQSNPA